MNDPITEQAIIKSSQPVDLSEFVGLSPEHAMHKAKEAVQALVKVINAKPKPLIINNKQYLEFSDWQLIGLYFGVMAKTIRYQEMAEYVEKTNKVTGDVYSERIFTGYSVEASAMKSGQIITTAIAECTVHEKNWKDKDRNSILQMAQVRAQRAALKNCMRWVFSFARIDVPEAHNIDEDFDPEALNNETKGE